MKNNGCDENDNSKSFSLLKKIKEAIINRPFLDIESFLKKYDSWLKFQNELREKSYDQLVVLYSGAISKKNILSNIYDIINLISKFTIIPCIVAMIPIYLKKQELIVLNQYVGTFIILILAVYFVLLVIEFILKIVISRWQIKADIIKDLRDMKAEVYKKMINHKGV